MVCGIRSHIFQGRGTTMMQMHYAPQNNFYIFEQMRLNHVTAVSSPAVQNNVINMSVLIPV